MLISSKKLSVVSTLFFLLFGKTAKNCLKQLMHARDSFENIINIIFSFASSLFFMDQIMNNNKRASHKLPVSL